MKKIALAITLSMFISSNAEENYQLIVNIKDRTEESRLKGLGFTKCRPLNQNTLICVESKDINQLLRLRDFLISQNINAKVVEGEKKQITDKENQNKENQKDKLLSGQKKDDTQTAIPENKFLIRKSTKKLEEQEKYNPVLKESLTARLDENLKVMYLYLNAGNLEKAAEIARTLLNTKYSADARFVLGIVNLKKENFKEACNIFSSLKSVKREARDLEIDSCWVYYMQEGYNNLENLKLSDALRNFEKSLSYKDNLESRIGIFYVYLKQRDFEPAGKVVKELYEKFPENRKVIRAYIDYLIETKNFEELKNFEMYLTDAEKQLIENQSLYSQLEKASKLIKDREFEIAENILKGLYIKYPSNVYVLLNLGYLYLEKGDIYTAENYYKNVLIYDKNNKDALKGLKAVYVKLGKYEEALQIIERLKTLGIKDDDENKIKELYYIQKAQDNFKIKNFSQAESYAREVLNLNPNNFNAYLTLANIRKEKGDNEEYFKFLSKAYELQPENFGVKLAYMYGLLNFEMFDQVKMLLTTIDKTKLSSDEKEELKQFYRTLYYKLASYYLNNKNYSKAKKVAIEGLEIFKVDSGLYEVLGWSCYNLKEYECSKKAFEQTLALNPSNEMAKLGLAYIYLNANEKEKLIRLLKSLEDSKDIKVLEGVATVYTSMGNYSDAERILNKLERIRQQTEDTVYIHKRDIKDTSEPLTVPKSKKVDREIPFILDDNYSSNIYNENYYQKQDIHVKKRELLLTENEKDVISSKNSESDETIKALKEKIQKEKQQYTSYVEIGTKFRDKSGEKGKSKLTDTSPYIMVHYFFNEKLNVFAGSYMTNLNSGELADYKNFGSPQNENILRQVPSSYTGAEPFAGINLEGEKFVVNSRVASTPIVNTGVKENVTYIVEGKIKTENIKTGIGIYKKPIRDSVLSYIGTVDPYTVNTSWGRAIEDGIRASFEKTEGDKYLIYSELNIGNIKGKDIQENKRINLIFMPKFNIGSLISDKDFAGLFIMYDRFLKDQDCYYYGCGGYFSPKNLLIVAPMLEGFKYMGNDFGLHYKVFLGLLSINNKSKNSIDTSFDGYLGGIYRLYDNIFLNLAGEYRKTSKYNEVFSSLSLQYFFGNRYNITEKDLLRQEKEIYKTW